MNKVTVYNIIKSEINTRIVKLHKALQNQKESLTTASESTAGDKHNTSRAMMHIEIEKFSKQLAQLLQLKKLIAKINPEKKTEVVTLGSLVETNNGWLSVTVPLGRVKVENEEIMVISLASPVGQALHGKKTGQSTHFNEKTWKVISVN